LTKKIQTDKGF